VRSLRAEQPKISPIPVKTDDFSSSSKLPDLHLVPPSLLFEGYQRLFARGERKDGDADYSLPSNAEIKYEWSYTCTLSYSSQQPHRQPYLSQWTLSKLFSLICKKTDKQGDIKNWYTVSEFILESYTEANLRNVWRKAAVMLATQHARNSDYRRLKHCRSVLQLVLSTSSSVPL
jgi:hypothetical protein